MRCRVGDLAVVISADIPSNLGRIVKVLARHDGCGLLRFKRNGMVWNGVDPLSRTLSSVGRRGGSRCPAVALPRRRNCGRS